MKNLEHFYVGTGINREDDPAGFLFEVCDRNPRLLMKAMRKVMKFSQAKLADRLLTYQSNICRYERGSIVDPTERARLLYNLKLEWKEFCYANKEPAIVYLLCAQCSIEYLRLEFEALSDAYVRKSPCLIDNHDSDDVRKVANRYLVAFAYENDKKKAVHYAKKEKI